MNAICVAGTVFLSGIIKWAIQTQSFHHGVYIILGHIQIDIVSPTMKKVVEGDSVMRGVAVFRYSDHGKHISGRDICSES